MWTYLRQIEAAEQLVQWQHALFLQQFNLPLVALSIIALLLLLHLYGLFIILLFTGRFKVSVCMKTKGLVLEKDFILKNTVTQTAKSKREKKKTPSQTYTLKKTEFPLIYA